MVDLQFPEQRRVIEDVGGTQETFDLLWLVYEEGNTTEVSEQMKDMS